MAEEKCLDVNLNLNSSINVNSCVDMNSSVGINSNGNISGSVGVDGSVDFFAAAVGGYTAIRIPAIIISAIGNTIFIFIGFSIIWYLSCPGIVDRGYDCRARWLGLNSNYFIVAFSCIL